MGIKHAPHSPEHPASVPAEASTTATSPTTATTGHPPVPTLKAKRRAFVATLIGNALESYDFAIYAFFSVTIGMLFFPDHSPSTALLMSVAVYGVGFIMRPLGAIMFGMHADRYGRRSALTWTLTGMGLGTMVIACAPTCAQLGPRYAGLAPVLLVFGRLLQGFSQGGEVGTAYATLIEIDRHKGRCFRSATELSSSAFAGVCAAATVLALTHTLSADAMTTWGWRVPFFIGALAAPFGLILRSQMIDDRPTTPVTPIRHTGRLVMRHWKRLLLCLFVLQGTMNAFVMAGYYLPVHAMHWLGFELKTVHWIGIASSTTLMISTPLFGFWSDWIKRRKPFALGGRLISAALLIPAYWLINHYPSLLLIMAVAAGMKLCLGMAASTTSALITESFPKEIRATTTSICYAAAGTLFGGTAQIIAVASVKWSGNLLAPAIYATVGLIISAVAVLLLKETGQHAVD